MVAMEILGIIAEFTLYTLTSKNLNNPNKALIRRKNEKNN